VARFPIYDLCDMHWDWEAFRAYISPVLLAVIAIFGLAKDSKDYKERAREPGISGPRRFARQQMLVALYVITVVLLIFGLFDIHGTRKQAEGADAERQTNEKQITALQKTVDAGNTMLAQQRKDFLNKFSEMSDRVGQLQSQVKTADLQEEATQLRSDLAATRKAVENPKVALSFWLVSDNGMPSRTLTLPRGKDGVVHIKFWAQNDTDSTAVDGVIVFFVCDQCKIVKDPAEFSKLPGSPENTRNMDFQRIFAHSNLPPHEADVLPPAGVSSFVVGMDYRCRNCENHEYVPNGLNQKTLPPALKATVFIQ
jgi:hypothetical protein